MYEGTSEQLSQTATWDEGGKQENAIKTKSRGGTKVLFPFSSLSMVENYLAPTREKSECQRLDENLNSFRCERSKSILGKEHKRLKQSKRTLTGRSSQIIAGFSFRRRGTRLLFAVFISSLRRRRVVTACRRAGRCVLVICCNWQWGFYRVLN